MVNAKFKEILNGVMRKPKQSKIHQRTIEDLRNLAERAVYTGSPEHKVKRWWGGLPQGKQLPGGQVGRFGRQNTTICPLTRESERNLATQWIRKAIRARQCIFLESDKNFPKKVWYEADGRIWMGLLVNDGLGQSKGWPIKEEERNEIFG